jgi:predicted glutamine amidotransferase
MCELLAMSARFPTTIHLSLGELARHGGDTGPHRDGWGVGFVQDGDALVVREPEAASASRWVPFLRGDDRRSSIVLAHIRRATQGPRTLRNTQPFARELGGRVHLFIHNGMLPTIESDGRFAARRFRRVGDTDSEQACCALLDRLAPLWEDGLPSLEARLGVIGAFARDLRELGPANFIYTDGDAVFAHGHRRKDDTGQIRPPGLHVLCRSCSPESEGLPLAGISIPHEARQEVALVASVPLSAEHWTPLAEGEIVVLRDGRVIRREHG